MNKKVLAAVTALSVASLLTACSNDTKKDSTSKEVKSEKVVKPKKDVKKFKAITQKDSKVEMTILNIVNEKMSGNDEDYTNAEYNTDLDVKDKYYRTTVEYSFKNISDQLIDLAYGEQSLETKDGQMYTDSSSSHSFFNDIDLVKVKPGNKVDGKFYLLTKDKNPDLSSFTFNWQDLSIDSENRNGDGTLSLNFTK